jgi:hypothetical protein
VIQLSPEFRAKVDVTSGVRQFVAGPGYGSAFASREIFHSVIAADKAVEEGCILIKDEWRLDAGDKVFSVVSMTKATVSMIKATRSGCIIVDSEREVS